MKAVVLAAGKGTRLRPLTHFLPKVMIRIKGKPVLEYHLDQLARAGIRDVYINLHYLPDKTKSYFDDGSKWGIRIQYSYEPTVLGTAGAVKKLEAELGDDPFLVVYGDNFLEMDYEKFIDFSESNEGIGAVAVFEKDDVTECGILEVGKRGRILRFMEKPNPSEAFSHWANAGIFYFRKRIFSYVGPGYSDFGYDVLPGILKAGETLVAYKLKTQVWGIDNLESLMKLEELNSGE